jgi:hypothetical protein
MARRLLSHNNLTGVSEYFHENGADSGNYVIETEQKNLDHITDYCKEAREANKMKGYGEGKVDYKIPAAIAGQLMKKGLLFDTVYMAKFKRENPQYRLFDAGTKYFKGGF